MPQGDSFFVFRVVDGLARRVPVKLGVRREGQVELLDNVKAGDRIVTAGVRVQRDGQPVRLMVDMTNEDAVVAMFVHEEGKRWLLASTEARGSS